MTDVKALRTRIDESGMTIVHIAKKTGILRETLYSRLKTGDFKLSEVRSLTEILNLSVQERDAIFFMDNSELKSTNL